MELQGVSETLDVQLDPALGVLQFVVLGDVQLILLSVLVETNQELPIPCNRKAVFLKEKETSMYIYENAVDILKISQNK